MWLVTDEGGTVNLDHVEQIREVGGALDLRFADGRMLAVKKGDAPAVHARVLQALAAGVTVLDLRATSVTARNSP